MDIDINNNDNVKKLKLTKLFIKQIYENVTSPTDNMRSDDNYLLFNNRRLDSIYIQGVITKIFEFNDPLTGITEMRAMIDDGTATLYILNFDPFMSIKKGYYVLAHGDLSLNTNSKIAFLHPSSITVCSNPNIEILWNLELIHYQEKK